uniref:Uncharacterized protein n=1 Tax=Vespula pensylvanica TaxID=30213 RepID=A0A834MZS4_VESPE|nr:hypothetical protein H0235_017692 [Vespula pensylvanica]
MLADFVVVNGLWTTYLFAPLSFFFPSSSSIGIDCCISRDRTEKVNFGKNLSHSIDGLLTIIPREEKRREEKRREEQSREKKRREEKSYGGYGDAFSTVFFQQRMFTRSSQRASMKRDGARELDVERRHWDHLASLRFVPWPPTPVASLSLLLARPLRRRAFCHGSGDESGKVIGCSRGRPTPATEASSRPYPHHGICTSSRHCIGRPVALSFRLGAC